MALLDFHLVKAIHCIGVGGVGLSGLAELLKHQGFSVSGSDIKDSEVIQRLIRLGFRIYFGHQAKNLQSPDLVIYSSAITKENPEFQAAKNLGIPLVSRGKFLAQMMENYQHRIAISGTHGKTTTSGAMAFLLDQLQLDPTYIVGGRIRGEETTARLGRSNLVIAEADESDASFLFMQPTIVVVTNIEADHLETYRGNFKDLQASFFQFIENVPEEGCVLLGIDCPKLRSLLPKISRSVITFGLSEDSDYCAYDVHFQGLRSECKVLNPKGEVISLNLNLPGQLNILNVLPAFIVSTLLGENASTAAKGLSRFPGMYRRFQYHGKIHASEGQAVLFEDYGHHPSAILATILMVRKSWPESRIVMVFQPHRYTRTRDLRPAFLNALSQVDVLLMLDIYAASEEPIKGSSAEDLFEALRSVHQGYCIFVLDKEKVSNQLQILLQPNDIVILQGAGDVGSLVNTLIKEVI